MSEKAREVASVEKDYSAVFLQVLAAPYTNPQH